MTITAAIVLYMVIWFMVFFVVLPLRLQSQAEAGEVVPGTPASAPAHAGVKRKALIATLVGTVLWAVVAGIILSGLIGVRDIDWFGRMGPAPAAVTAPD